MQRFTRYACPRMQTLLNHPRMHIAAVAALILLGAVLALTSLLTDSVTFDESSHLTAGYSILKTGDYRLAPDHPPLAKLWCALPLVVLSPQWPPITHAAWVHANTFQFARAFLFDRNDGQTLVRAGRVMMVVLLVATLLIVYGLGRTLFGSSAGLLTLAAAALSPTLLAHGRYVTTDLPITLLVMLVLWCSARMVARVTAARVILAGLTLAAAAVTKFSWPLVLPAVLVMVILAMRRTPRQMPRLIAATLAVFIITWAGIWACYGGRTSMIAPSATTPENREQTQRQLALYWQGALHDAAGAPHAGFVPLFLHVTASGGLLPDAYLLGLAQTLDATSGRRAYFCGEYGTTGWRAYFPLALAIKTPLATLLLTLAGAVALIGRSMQPRAPILLVGLLVFAAVYFTNAVLGSFNIGHRHLLPIYPVMFVGAGAVACWLRNRLGRVLVAGAFAWLVIANLWIHPHYLCYFNELIGGPRNGPRYLADSNIDWGQDLLRLQDYVDRHGDHDASLKLAYFGSADPKAYVDCTALPSFMDFAPRAVLDAGMYVVSVNQSLGLNDPEVRDAFWEQPEVRRGYRALHEIATASPHPDETGEHRQRRRQAAAEFEQLRYKRLLNQLAHRPPDAYVGYSLYVYHLTAEDVARLTAP